MIRRLGALQLRSQGMTLREISAETGVPRSTISVWLHKQEQTEGTDGAARG